MAEQGCLLSSCMGKTRAGGSNPPLSAPLFCVTYRLFRVLQGNTYVRFCAFPTLGLFSARAVLGGAAVSRSPDEAR